MQQQLKNLGCYITPKAVRFDFPAIHLEQKHHLSFWNAMIISSALQMKCNILWTEDLNSGQSVDGLVIQNPFGH